MIRMLIALFLSIPVYFALDFGVTYFCCMALQVLATMDIKLKDAL